jgi:hypothetical protein
MKSREIKGRQISQLSDVCNVYLMKLLFACLASLPMFCLSFFTPAPEVQLCALEPCIRSLLSAAGGISLQLYI